MSRRNWLTLLAVLAAAYACYVRAEQNPYARYVTAGFSVIDRFSLQQPPAQELFAGAMQGMVEVLRQHGDEHTQFVAASEHKAFREDMSQEFGGVGIRLRALGDPPIPTVVGPPEFGAPAFEAGVLSGDRVHAIDGKRVAELPLDQVTELVRGPIGEPVTLEMTRFDGSERRNVVLQRAVITVDSVLGDVRQPDGRWSFRLPQGAQIGYVRITKFGDKTTTELGAALAQTEEKAKPLAGLILDLRDNYGGSLDSAVEISDMFLKAGLPIVTTRGRDKRVRERHLSTASGPYPELPLSVITNRNSASAAEIVAACLQDYGRAVVVGERTYGKGTVQRIMPLESGRSSIRITSASYWRPSGQNIHRMPGEGPADEWGVSPDAGWKVDLDDQQYAVWRRFRSRRDIMGDRPHPELLHQLDLEDGTLPEDYVDRAVQQAVAALQSRSPTP